MKDDSFIGDSSSPDTHHSFLHPIEDGSTIHLVERSDEELRAEQTANATQQPQQPNLTGIPPFFSAATAGTPNMIFHSMNLDSSLGAEQMSSQIAQSLMGAFENAFANGALGIGAIGSLGIGGTSGGDATATNNNTTTRSNNIPATNLNTTTTTSTSNTSTSTNATNNTTANQQRPQNIINLGSRIPTPIFSRNPILSPATAAPSTPSIAQPFHCRKPIGTAADLLNKEIIRLMDNLGLETTSGNEQEMSAESASKNCLERMASLMNGLKNNLLDIASSLSIDNEMPLGSSADWAQIHNTILVLQEISPSILCLKRMLSASKAIRNDDGKSIQLPSNLEIPFTWLDATTNASGSNASVSSGSSANTTTTTNIGDIMNEERSSIYHPSIDSLD